MKTFAKILSVLLCLTMAIGLVAVVASASEAATVSFADAANRTSFTEEVQVWEQNGVTVTNNKAESKSNVADYSNPARFYASSALTVEYAGMMQIEFNCSTEKYANVCLESINAQADANVTASVNEKVVTVVLTNAADSFTISCLTAQVRMDSISVYTSVNEGGEEGGEDAPVVTPDPVEVTIPEALKLAEQDNGNLYIIRGTITEIASTTWGNMYIADEDGNSIYVYGVYSADGSVRYDALETKPVVGDQVVLQGVLTTYNSNPQMKNGWMLSHTPGEVEPEPEPDPVEVSVADAIAIGSAKEHNTFTAEKYIVTGVVVEIANETYGNMYIEDAEGNKLYVYGLYSADGSVRFDAMEVKPAVGDTVTLVGILGQYNGNAQMKNGWMTAHTPAEGGEETPENPDGPPDTGDVITLAICALLVSGGAVAILPKKREN